MESLQNKMMLLLLSLVMATAVYGQKMFVSGFRLDAHDLTGNSEAAKVLDDNDEVCALIRVQTTQKGFSFDGGSVGVAKVEENHVAEVWVFVPAALRRIMIRHPQLGSLEDYYYFPETLQHGRTYVMTLSCGTVDTIVHNLPTTQFLAIRFEPKDAMVEIDGVMVETMNGEYSQSLSRGRHEYRISKKNYHSVAGVVQLGDKVEKLSHTLSPAFGWIEVLGPVGASVYIDGEKVGEAPKKSDAIASGTYDVRVGKDKYLPFRQQLTVKDNEVTTINPTLTANFVTVTLATENGAEIWVNGEKRGSGTVTVDLTPGDYSFETRKTNHRSRSANRTITMASGGKIDLPAPVAITGTLMVNVLPLESKVSVDGKQVGETPMQIDRLLIGSHEVVISRAGCADRREQVVIAEGKTTTIEGRLAQGQDVRLSCGVAGARWTVDGVDRGVGAEITVNLSYAEHSVKIKADEYVDYEERFVVGVGSASRAFAMQKVVADVLEIPVKEGVTIRMRLVEGGTFQMGSENGHNDEKPVHSVTLSDYYIGETEVTQALWQAVMGSNPSYRKGDNLPVENVSWKDCQKFIKKLNKMTGRTFALPTEAQWEYAARGGNKSKGYTYAGSNTIDNVAWYDGNSSSQTHPVGTKQANELGLYDMSGNVYEWCSDWYGSYSSSSQTDPTGVSSGSARVLRGGGWDGNASRCRSTDRYYYLPGSRGSDFGLRLVLLF